MRVERVLLLQGVDGTPVEIRAALADVQFTANGQVQHRDVDDTEPLRRVLRRRPPLSELHVTMLQVSYKAGAKGLSGTDLAAKMGLRNVQQFNGVLGTFGRRISATFKAPEGTAPSEIFFGISKLPSGGYHYVLLPKARRALEQEGMV
jgi:hypothetical protein